MSPTEPAERARAVFAEQFAGSGGSTLVAVAPGRVNLVGGHTDYNDGFVLPAAIDRRVAVAAAPRDDRTVRIYADAPDEQRTFAIDDIATGNGPGWLDYVRGVAIELDARGHELRGADLAVASTLPVGAGLGSSAAFEVAVGRALAAVADADVAPRELATACRAAEREFVGVDCGVMDQLTAALGRRDHALFVDCRSLDVDPRRLDADRARIVVADTTVRHELAESAYNDRVAACREAVRLLDGAFEGDVQALRDVSPAALETQGDRLPSTVRRRAEHVVAENRRVEEAAAALERGALDRVGELLYESHESLRDDYEVSCEELDVLVDLSRAIPGVHGARMTGAGFGGCVVALVQPDDVDRFRERLSEGYRERTGLDPDVYVCRPAAGSRVVR